MESCNYIRCKNSNVLILIIMEDTHGEWNYLVPKISRKGLNPYYNGRYSWRPLETKKFTIK